jgi:hypothetical protein
VRRTGDCLPDAEGGLGNGRIFVSGPCPFENFLWRLVLSRVVDGTGLVLPADYPCCEYYIGIPINKKIELFCLINRYLRTIKWIVFAAEALLQGRACFIGLDVA